MSFFGNGTSCGRVMLINEFQVLAGQRGLMLKLFLTPSNVTGLNVNDRLPPEQSLHQIKHFSNVQRLCMWVSDVTMNILLCCCASSLAFCSVLEGELAVPLTWAVYVRVRLQVPLLCASSLVSQLPFQSQFRGIVELNFYFCLVLDSQC